MEPSGSVVVPAVPTSLQPAQESDTLASRPGVELKLGPQHPSIVDQVAQRTPADNGNVLTEAEILSDVPFKCFVGGLNRTTDEGMF